MGAYAPLRRQPDRQPEFHKTLFAFAQRAGAPAHIAERVVRPSELRVFRTKVSVHPW
jgi:hypothetical protein